MNIIDNYSDLVIKIDIIKEQINLNEWELKYWFGVGPDGRGIPLGGKGSHIYGAIASMDQGNDRLQTIYKLKEQLAFYEKTKERMDALMNSLEALDYKIAIRRIVEKKTHQEIADDLGYSHQYIKERWAKIRTYSQHTDVLV